MTKQLNPNGFFSESDLDDLQYSAEYASYIMDNGNRPCCDGDMLTQLQEEGYLFIEFIDQLEQQLSQEAA